MKKQIGIILVLALLLPVLAGCENTGGALAQNPLTVGRSANAESQNEQTALLTKEEALNIALTDAQLTQADVRDIDIELDWEGGKTHYDVDFEKGDLDYDYEIDAQTGEILRSYKERD